MLALISGSSLPDLHLIKLFSILSDVVLAWSVMQLVGLFRRSAAWKLAAFFLVLFWPTVVLNGALWSLWIAGRRKHSRAVAAEKRAESEK